MPFANAFSVPGNVVDPIRRSIIPARVEVRAGRIESILPATGPFDTYLLPGFVDAHVHIESSLLTPAEFARLAVVHGTVATVSDPHEIANVLGVAGVKYMQASAAAAPLKVMFGAPSCVPATPFDLSGAHLGVAEVAQLLDDPQVGYLSEMMNFPGVLAGDAEVLGKIAAAASRGKPVDGHAPGLRGNEVLRYAAAGITTDHESSTLDEALDKLRCGIKCLIREGSAAKNFDALHPLLAEHAANCMFCSDDKHPHELVEGHINLLVRRAVALGYNLFDVLQAATVNPAKHYRLPVGLLQPGDPADMIELPNLTDFVPRRVWIDGQLVADGGRTLLPHRPAGIVNRFETALVSAEHLRVPAGQGQMRVIRALDGQLLTVAEWEDPKVILHEVVADADRDLLKLAQMDRYGRGNVAVGFVRGFGLRHGAIAASVAHDMHNVLGVGSDDALLADALNLVVAQRGGLAVITPHTQAVLPLPIAGLMSDGDGYEVARQYAALDRLAKQLGSPLAAPFMTLSFMALLVIPELKLGPHGLFDVAQFIQVKLFE